MKKVATLFLNKKNLFSLLLLLCLNNFYGQSTANFIVPDTICVNQSFSITNTSTNASTYYWNFCSGNINTIPIATNLGTMGGVFSIPVYPSIQKEKNDYYVFITNNSPGTLTRLFYGSSLLNTPVATNLGNLSGVLPDYLEGIYIQQEGNNWYGVAVGGWSGGGVTSQVIQLNFGNSLANMPIAISLGNIGSLDYPKQLEVFQSGGNYYGFIINTVGNTLTRLNFGNSISNTPTGTNLGNLGNLNEPGGIALINYQNNWYGYIVNQTGPSYTRLDFGNSLLNIPTGTNLGNPDGLAGLSAISVFIDCGGVSGLITDGGSNNFGSISFPNGPDGNIKTIEDGNPANFNYPHSIERIRVDDTLYVFIPNASNNTISRLAFISCTNSSIPSSNLQSPPPISYNTTGVYDITLTTDETLITESKICKQVVVIDKPTVNVNSASICAGASTTLIASGATSYTWLPSIGLRSITGASVTATPTVTTTYTVTGTSNCGTNTAISTVTIFSIPNASIVGDNTICSGESNVLTALGGSSYQWSGGSTASTSSINVMPLVTTTYSVVAYNGTCVSLPASITVIVNSSPSVSISGQNLICQGGTANLFGNIFGGAAPYNYLWSNGSISTSIIISPISLNTSISIHVTDKNGCSDSASINVTMLPNPISSIAGATLGCDSMVVSFINSSTNASTYFWDFGDGNTSNLFNPIHIYRDSGSYNITLIATNVAGCADTSTLNYNVKLIASPIALINTETSTSHSNQSIAINNISQGGINCVLYFGDGDSLAGCNWVNTIHNYLFDGIYTVTQIITNSTGCSDTVQVKVFIECETTLFIPNAFTPNSDGRNDLFLVYGVCITGFKLMIFDRWGELIFETNDVAKGWDGKYKGNIVEQGVYVWKVNYNTNNTGEQSRIGSITVVL